MFIPASLYLLVIHLQGKGSYGVSGLLITLLLVGSGVATSIPLLLFGSAARSIDLSLLGILQYIAPSMQFLIGVIVYGEQFTHVRLIGFGLIWTALIIFWIEGALSNKYRPVGNALPKIPAGTKTRGNFRPQKRKAYFGNTKTIIRLLPASVTQMLPSGDAATEGRQPKDIRLHTKITPRSHRLACITELHNPIPFRVNRKQRTAIVHHQKRLVVQRLAIPGLQIPGAERQEAAISIRQLEDLDALVPGIGHIYQPVWIDSHPHRFVKLPGLIPAPPNWVR